jgi:hypothetical protein
VLRHPRRRRAAEPDRPPGSAATPAASALQRRGPDAGADSAGPDGLTALATMVVGMAGPLAVQLLLGLGVRDENRLTNLLFWAGHPELLGQKIQPGQRDLARDWVGIRDRVVRPALEARTPAGPADGRDAGPTAPSAPTVPATPAGPTPAPGGPTPTAPGEPQDLQLAAFVAGLNNPAATAAADELAALEQRSRAAEREGTEETGAGRDELVAGIAALRAKVAALDGAGLAPAPLAALKARLYRALNAISPYYSQGRNIDLLEGKEQAKELGTTTSVTTRTGNITSLAMALEALGKGTGDYDAGKRDEVTAAAKVFNAEVRAATLTAPGDGTAWGKLAGLRLPDFMELAAIAEVLKGGGASAEAVTGAAVTAWGKILSIDFLRQLAERFGATGTVKHFTLDPTADKEAQQRDLAALSGWGGKHRSAVEKLVDARNQMAAASGKQRERLQQRYEQALAKLRGATDKSTIDQKLPIEAYKRAMTAQVGAELGAGAAVVVLISGHYVRLQAIFDDHVVVDDPAQQARANRAVTWEEARAMGYFKHRLVLQG